jgi:hypothetical protein
MPHWQKIAIVAALFMLAGALPLAMQRSTGSIEGVLTDDSGPVVGATVEARGIMFSETAQAASDRTGFYRIAGLRRGAYSLWITAARHDSVSIPRVYVEEGATARKDVHLRITRSTESEFAR